MSRDKFGTIINAPSNPHQSIPVHLYESAPRPKGREFTLDELNPLTTTLLIASAFRVPGHKGERGRMPFEGSFSALLDTTYPVSIVSEARERLLWGRSPGLQQYVLAQAYEQFKASVVLDTVQAIADITRFPRITQPKYDRYATLHEVGENRDIRALCSPLRDLSTLAIAGLKEL